MTTGNDTIAAIATGTGGAIALIRISGERAIEIGDALFRGVHGRRLSGSKGFTLHYGNIVDGEITVDDVLLSLFRAPHSYTGEDMVEISCHASPYVVQRIMQLIGREGGRPAGPGEFTLRAFLAGKMDLSQAEAVADVIAADNEALHTLASRQMRGGYSSEFNALRDKLLHLVSLLELELDFSEEDVEFADRDQLLDLLTVVEQKTERLISSFSLGNIIKNGIPVAIIGEPNVGKSTLLNAILREDKALVSDIAGTTRDVIEDTLNIGGTVFRFIDTAGIRETDDPLESMGIERTFDRISKAAVVLLMADAANSTDEICSLYAGLPFRAEQQVAILLNKCDRLEPEELDKKQAQLAERIPRPVFRLSAKLQSGLDDVTGYLKGQAISNAQSTPDSTVIFNARHHEALCNAREALVRAREGIGQSLPGDLLAQDIREILHHIGSVTGNSITLGEVLQSIFSRFCIGK